MHLFRAILQSHYETDMHLASRESAARSANGKSQWARKRVLNDHAYFVLLFAQLESHINDECSKLTTKKKAATRWKTKRLWDTTDIDHLSFMRKVALLCEKGHTAYNKVYYYYEKVRCEIAHGNSAAVGPILLPTIASDILSLAKQLKA